MERSARRRKALTAAVLTGAVALGTSACGGSSRGSTATATSVPTVTGNPSTSATAVVSPTVTVFARTDAPAEEILAGASQPIQETPDDVMSIIAAEVLFQSEVYGPVRYARITESSVLTHQMTWFTDNEIDGATYLVMVPHKDPVSGKAYLLVTARADTDLREAHEIDNSDPVDLSSLGTVETLTDSDLESVSDWRPFMNRMVEVSDIRAGEPT